MVDSFAFNNGWDEPRLALIFAAVVCRGVSLSVEEEAAER